MDPGKRWPEVVLLATTSLLFWYRDLFSFLQIEEFAGRDLASNYAFTWLMRQNLLHGEVFRWTGKWMLGFPSFRLYPPLFFLFTSGLDLVTASVLDLSMWFKLVVFLSVFLVPLVTYYLLREVFGREEAFLAGFYTLLFVFVYPPVSQAYQVFSVGLVAQGFSFFLLLVSAGLMLRDSTRYKLLSGVLLGLAALAHPFVAVAGFLLSASLSLLEKDVRELVPATTGGLIFLPWLLQAAVYLPFTASYSFAPANTGLFLYLLLPLVFAGGYRGKNRQALLLTFAGLLFLSTVELPVVSQELRFYTYTLGVGSVLAGSGAYRVLQYLQQEYSVDRRLLALTLLVPVIGFSLHAELPQGWSFDGEAGPLYDELSGMERGRVLVETSSSSISDSFVLQANIPVRTEHMAVNDVHLDSSTSANYILSLESWVSRDAVQNPICRSCNTSVPGTVVERRLDDLGVRYVVARTRASRDRLQDLLEYRGRQGDYWLFENTEGHRLFTRLETKPVALEGSYRKWKRVNDLLFISNSSREVAWRTSYSDGYYSRIIDMEGIPPVEVFNRVRSTEPEPFDGDRSLVRAKFSYYPTMAASAGSFNTVLYRPGTAPEQLEELSPYEAD